MKNFLCAGLLLFPITVPLQSCATTTMSVEDQVAKAKEYLEAIQELRKSLDLFPDLKAKIGEERLAKVDLAISTALELLDKVAKGEKLLQKKDWVGMANLVLEVTLLIEEIRDGN